MKLMLIISLSLLLGLIDPLHSYASTASAYDLQPIVHKQMKILVLVIAGGKVAVYPKLEEIWRSYMHIDPDSVEAYFIKAQPDLPVLYEIKGDVIWSRSQENFYPGILNKTLLSMECLQSKLHEFDYVVRTNLSSFYVFPRLLDFVKTLPKTKCYCGVTMKYGAVKYASGAGYILSSDLAEMLLENKDEVMNINNWDDVVVGSFFAQRGIKIIEEKRLDLCTLEAWIQHQNRIPNEAYHFRVKNPNANLRLTDDIYIHQQLLSKFYN